MKTLRILNNNHLPYKKDQIVQFIDAEADAIILSGAAVMYTPGAYTPYIPPAAGKSPVTNLGLGGGGGGITDVQQNAEIQTLKAWQTQMDANLNGTADTTDKDENAPDYVQSFNIGLLP